MVFGIYQRGALQDGKYVVVCHKLVLKSVSYPNIVKNTPILIKQNLVMCTLNTHKVVYPWNAYILWMSSYMLI